MRNPMRKPLNLSIAAALLVSLSSIVWAIAKATSTVTAFSMKSNLVVRDYVPNPASIPTVLISLLVLLVSMSLAIWFKKKMKEEE